MLKLRLQSWGLAHSKSVQGIALMLIFGVVGSVFIFVSHAATPAVSFEAESGVVSAAACALPDGSASGAGAVKLACSSGSTGTRTSDCYATPSTPHLCNLPDATNTGVEAGHTLTKIPASGSAGGPGWVSSNGDVTVCGTSCASPGSSSATAQDFEVPTNHGVTIPAPGNVTVKDFKVDGQSGRTSPQDFEGVSVAYGAHAVTISRCDINGDRDTSPDSGPATTVGGSVNRGDAGVVILPNISGGGYANGGWGVTVSYCNIHGFHGHFWNKAEDASAGQTAAASQVHITRNYVHGVECWDYVDNTSCAAFYASHNDSSANTDHCNEYGQSNISNLSLSTKQNVLMDYNTFAQDYQPCESDIVAADSDNGQTQNLRWVVDHNLLVFDAVATGTGGNCVSPGRTGGAGKTAGFPSYVAVTNNHIGNCNPWLYDGPSLTGSGTGQNPNNVECGNVWDTAGAHAGQGADTSAWIEDANAAPTKCTAPSWVADVPGWAVTSPP